MTQRLLHQVYGRAAIGAMAGMGVPKPMGRPDEGGPCPFGGRLYNPMHHGDVGPAIFLVGDMMRRCEETLEVFDKLHMPEFDSQNLTGTLPR
jgi:hypothetical protein